jgi:outer membrane protein TolC
MICSHALLVSVAAGFVLLLAAPLHGAEGVASRQVLTLERAVELADEHNPGLRAARSEYEAAGWAVWSARAALFPSVGLSSTARRVDPDTYRRANASLAFAEELGIDVEPFLYETTYETGFYATVPLWNGGRRRQGQGTARVGVQTPGRDS